MFCYAGWVVFRLRLLVIYLVGFYCLVVAVWWCFLAYDLRFCLLCFLILFASVCAYGVGFVFT